MASFGGKKKRGGGTIAATTKDVETVYRMLYPKPKPLLQYCKELVRHGELVYYSPNTNTTKPRYFFLFDNALLLTKRTGKKRYWLKIYVHLRHGVTLVDSSPTDTQFRLMVTVKGRSRPIVMYGKTLQHKGLWVRDIQHVLWVVSGRKGPDPSAAAASSSSTSSSSPTTQRGSAPSPSKPKVASRDSNASVKNAISKNGQSYRARGDSDDDDEEEEEHGSDFDEEPDRARADDDDDDDESETEIEYVNVKKDKSGGHATQQQPRPTAPPQEAEVARLTNGLDSLVFDPFSDFIPPTPTAGPPLVSAPTGLHTPLARPLFITTIIARLATGAPFGIAPTPFGPPPQVYPQQAYGAPFGGAQPVGTVTMMPPYGGNPNPFGGQQASIFPGISQQNNTPSCPLFWCLYVFSSTTRLMATCLRGTDTHQNTGNGTVSPQAPVQYHQQQHYQQQQAHLQQQLHQLAAIQQQMQGTPLQGQPIQGSAVGVSHQYFPQPADDPFTALSQRN